MENITQLVQKWYKNYIEINNQKKRLESLKNDYSPIIKQNNYKAEDLDELIKKKNDLETKTQELSHKEFELKSIEELIVSTLEIIGVEAGAEVQCYAKGTNDINISVYIWYYVDRSLGNRFGA